MVETPSASSLITGRTLTEYFRDSLTTAMDKQKVEAAAETVYYLVNLLSSFSRSDQLYEKTPDGVMIRPLALIYADAINAPTQQARHHALRRMGDIALFIAGLFSYSLNRKAVDIDYYVGMGGHAYSYLADSVKGSGRRQALSEVYAELSNKFVVFVDVLNEVGCANDKSDSDILRLYEVWVRTGSPRAAHRLRELGVEPAPEAVSHLSH